MGVCCIVFDIDGMLFEFSMNFLNIEKNKILRIFCLQNFIFSSRFMLFPTFKKKLVSKKIWGGCQFFIFFVWKNTSLLFHFAFYAIFNITFFFEILKSAPSLTG